MPIPFYSDGSSNISRYSPLTLNADWGRGKRLLFVLCCSALGTLVNGFFVSSFIVEPSLRKIGNVFLACVGFADLMITAGVMTPISVVLLSGQWESEQLCYVLQFVTIWSTYAYNMFYMFITIETFFRLLRTPEEYKRFVAPSVVITSILVFTVSFVTAGVGVYFGYDYNYCTRNSPGNVYFQAVTAAVFQIAPFMITTLGLVTLEVVVLCRARTKVQYKRTQSFDCDNTSIPLHLCAYLLFAASWIPYLVIVHAYPESGDGQFYHSVWLGLIRPVLGNSLYACLHRNFRRAFRHLFNYCCCKNSLPSSYTTPHRRVHQCRSALGDVRVHILHQAIPRYYTTRETQGL